MSKQIRKSFNEWLKFLKYREVNKNKKFCNICKHWHNKNDFFTCWLLKEDTYPQIIYKN